MADTDNPGVNLLLTEVTVCALPPDTINHNAYAIKVVWRGRDTYAVLYRDHCLSTSGEWDYEPQNSSRTDDWLATHRFDYQTALELAVKAAPEVTVNGRTAREVSKPGWRTAHVRSPTLAATPTEETTSHD